MRKCCRATAIILALFAVAIPWMVFSEDLAATDDVGMNARRTWRGPANSTFGFQVFRGQERLDLVVPKGYEGRSGHEDRYVTGIEVFEGVRATRTNSSLEMRGLSSVFDFQYKRDELEAVIFESRTERPGTNSCMACHGGYTPRTTVTMGRESTELTASPIRRSTGVLRIAPAAESSSRFTLSHWLTPRWQSMVRYRAGHIQNGSYELAASAMTFGANYEMAHRLLWDISGIWSKTETYERKRILESHLTWRPGRRLKLTVGGGAFLDGLAYFGGNMVELGQMSLGMDKENSRFLPALFKTIKEKQFGYLHSSIVYEYPF